MAASSWRHCSVYLRYFRTRFSQQTAKIPKLNAFRRRYFPLVPGVSALGWWGASQPASEPAKGSGAVESAAAGDPLNPVERARQEAIQRADALYHEHRPQELYQFLLHVVIEHRDDQSEELIWRLARAARDLAQLSSTPKEEKKRLTYQAMEHAQKALDLNQENFACHKWYAICLSDVGDYEGTKQKIANAFTIKQHFQRAADLNPQDATSVHLLGVWCMTFADMPWYQHKLAAAIFATPPTSTYQEALSYFQKAEEIEPHFYSSNLLMLGKALLKLQRKEEAKTYLQQARDYPDKTEEDRQVQEEAAKLLKTL